MASRSSPETWPSSEARARIACSAAITRSFSFFLSVSITANLYGSHQGYPVILPPLKTGGHGGYFGRMRVVSAVAYRGDWLPDPTSTTVSSWPRSIHMRRLPAVHGFRSLH